MIIIVDSVTQQNVLVHCYDCCWVLSRLHHPVDAYFGIPYIYFLWNRRERRHATTHKHMRTHTHKYDKEFTVSGIQSIWTKKNPKKEKQASKQTNK